LARFAPVLRKQAPVRMNARIERQMTSSDAGAPEGTISRRELRGILIGAMMAMFLAALDQTIVAPALPAIARDLGEFNAISWVVTAYLLASTAATPIFGKLSDLYGRRRSHRTCSC
jgi:hypothetical protein